MGEAIGLSPPKANSENPSELDAMAVPQPVSAPLTRAAIFLVLTINPGSDNRVAVRSFCADLPALVRAVGFRELEAGLSCVMGIGSDAWDGLFGDPRPAELHSFREIRAGLRHAVSTPGDLHYFLDTA
jgi:putative iron-dependent peroxidase